jgi:hypothetical protein
MRCDIVAVPQDCLRSLLTVLALVKLLHVLIITAGLLLATSAAAVTGQTVTCHAHLIVSAETLALALVL